MTAQHDQPSHRQDVLLSKLGFKSFADLLAKDLHEPANHEAQVTFVHRVGIYGGGIR